MLGDVTSNPSFPSTFPRISSFYIHPFLLVPSFQTSTMSTSVTLTFGKEDILNTILTFPDGTIAFSTSTKESFWKGRDTTVIQGQNYFAKTHASIDWRDKYFDINGQVLPFDRIKHTKTLSRWVELFF